MRTFHEGLTLLLGQVRDQNLKNEIIQTAQAIIEGSLLWIQEWEAAPSSLEHPILDLLGSLQPTDGPRHLNFQAARVLLFLTDALMQAHPVEISPAVFIRLRDRFFSIETELQRLQQSWVRLERSYAVFMQMNHAEIPDQEYSWRLEREEAMARQMTDGGTTSFPLKDPPHPEDSLDSVNWRSYREPFFHIVFLHRLIEQEPSDPDIVRLAAEQRMEEILGLSRRLTTSFALLLDRLAQNPNDERLLDLLHGQFTFLLETVQTLHEIAAADPRLVSSADLATNPVGGSASFALLLRLTGRVQLVVSRLPPSQRSVEIARLRAEEKLLEQFLDFVRSRERLSPLIATTAARELVAVRETLSRRTGRAPFSIPPELNQPATEGVVEPVLNVEGLVAFQEDHFRLEILRVRFAKQELGNYPADSLSFRILTQWQRDGLEQLTAAYWTGIERLMPLLDSTNFTERNTAQLVFTAMIAPHYIEFVDGLIAITHESSDQVQELQARRNTVHALLKKLTDPESGEGSSEGGTGTPPPIVSIAPTGAGGSQALPLEIGLLPAGFENPFM
ncbi:MAG: hypothetical protein Q7S00_01825, partial [bacterium]|nr:hypothetical protein [bacterium]